MKWLIVIAAIVGGGIYAVNHWDLLGKRVDCPACNGTRRQLPPESVCGTQIERQRLAPMTDKHTFCYTATPCTYCGGKGLVNKDEAADIPESKYNLRDLVGEQSAVLL